MPRSSRRNPVEGARTFPTDATSIDALRGDGPISVKPEVMILAYDVSWLLLKDIAYAKACAYRTMEIATSRRFDVPNPEAFDSWIVSIAANEAFKVAKRTTTPSSPLLKTGAHREAMFIADTLALLTVEHKLALLLRYRVRAPLGVLSTALDVRPRRLGQVLRDARERFAENSSLGFRSIEDATPPRPRDLDLVVTPLSKRDARRSKLGYPFRASKFPDRPENDERRAKIRTAVLVVALIGALIFAATRTWWVERPSLVDPATGFDEPTSEPDG